jgi:hypothetical protein
MAEVLSPGDVHPVFVGENEYLKRALDEGELTLDAWRLRRKLVREFAWAVPNDAALDALAELAPLVEIGAGGGYWAHLLRERGVDIVAYDAMRWNESEPDAEHEQKIWTEVLCRNHWAAADHPDRTLLLCWPSYGEAWAAEALGWGGERVAYIGEGEGGCTAEERFHELLAERFTETREVTIPQWDGIHDYLGIWEKR